MRKKIPLLILLLTCFFNYGQNLPKYENLIPKLVQSPNAAALNKFIEFPVNNFNGTANVSFPICEIKLKNLTIPITLKYHTGGIRVNEEASWVGLGWSLSAGGSITHQINGKDDEDCYSKYWNRYLPSINQLNSVYDDNNLAGQLINGQYVFDKETGTAVNILDRFMFETYDSEPDLYLYNMGNYSGKFISSNYCNSALNGIDLSNNSIIFKQNISNKTNANIVATTPDGFIYTFKDIEVSNNEVLTNTSYLLSEILTPDGELIKFNYKSFGQILNEKNWQDLYLGGNYNLNTDYFPSVPSLTESFVEIDKQSPQLYPNPIDEFSIDKRRTNNFIKTLFLTDIQFPEGSVEFVNGYRLDLYGTKLNKIIIKNKKGEIVKEFSFGYDYFIGNTPYGEDSSTVPFSESIKVDYPTEYLKRRLKLISFSEGTNNPITHKFNYNTETLPYKSSFAQDLWGYFNGKSNKTLLPDSFLYENALNIPKSFSRFEGANRIVDTTKVQAGILKEILYPTGGKTIFEYAPNEYAPNNCGGTCTQFSNCYSVYNSTYITASDPDPYKEPSNYPHEIVITPFEITQETLVDINITLFRDAQIPVGNSLNRSNYHFVSLEKKVPQSVDNWVPFKSNYIWDGQNGNIFFTEKDQILTPGQYRLVANYPDSYSPVLGSNMASISIVKKAKTDICSNYVGGLRIKKIKHKESETAQYLSTNYNYTNGVLVTVPSFTYNYSYPSQEVFTAPWGDKTIYSFLIKETYFSTSSIYPYSYSANGSLVGYRNVTETMANSENGKIEYEYSINPDRKIIGGSGLPGLFSTSSLNNGFLKSVNIFQKNNFLQPVSSTNYTSYIIDPKVYWGFKISPAVYKINDQATPEQHTNNLIQTMQTYFYPIVQGRTVIKEMTKSDNGELINGIGTSVQTKTTYNYSIPTLYFPTSIEETRSDGAKNRKEILYSTQYNDIWNELNGSQRGAYQDLINKNRVIPIQESSYANNEFISSSRINYKNWNSGASSPLVSPENIGTKNKGQTSYETQATFNVYDVQNGNILETQKIAGIPVSYIWGYNKTLLIAKIENVNYNSISSSIISAIQTASNTGTEQELLIALKALRDSLPNAMVTTYTHAPLIGVKSITDPRNQTIYYYYDSFNRLEYVTDHEGNVLNKNAYNYQNITNP